MRAMGNNAALPLPSFQQAGRAAPIFGCQTPEDWMKFIAGETRVGLFKKVVRVIQLESTRAGERAAGVLGDGQACLAARYKAPCRHW